MFTQTQIVLRIYVCDKHHFPVSRFALTEECANKQNQKKISSRTCKHANVSTWGVVQLLSISLSCRLQWITRQLSTTYPPLWCSTTPVRCEAQTASAASFNYFSRLIHLLLGLCEKTGLVLQVLSLRFSASYRRVYQHSSVDSAYQTSDWILCFVFFGMSIEPHCWKNEKCFTSFIFIFSCCAECCGCCRYCMPLVVVVFFHSLLHDILQLWMVPCMITPRRASQSRYSRASTLISIGRERDREARLVTSARM